MKLRKKRDLNQIKDKQRKEKKTLRNLQKHPSLIHKFNSRIRQEYMDADYLDKLDDVKKNVKLPDGTMVTQLEFYAIFMKEWNNAGVGPQHSPKKNRMHRTKEQVKNCTDRNNKRNNDVYGIAKKGNNLFIMGHSLLKENANLIQDSGVNQIEDSLINYLDGEVDKETFWEEMNNLNSENLNNPADDTDDKGD